MNLKNKVFAIIEKKISKSKNKEEKKKSKELEDAVKKKE